jgi:uncharacterized repeat protein (TIGR02059 family)
MKKHCWLTLSLYFLASLSLQSQTSWYNAAQSRIDTLRKGPFSIKVQTAAGVPVRDSIRIQLKKHAFPWGTAYDLSYGSTGMSTTNAGSTSSTVTSVYGDAEIYKTERWGKYIAYQLSAVNGKTYDLTFKMAELYFGTAGSRVFDVYVDGKRVLKDVDKYAWAKGKFVAKDSTVQVTAFRNFIKVELLATRDNASVNGLELREVTGASVFRLNSGGSTLTLNGKTYYGDAAYINNVSAANIPVIDDWYKANMLKYCNYGVCGNQFKWSGIEPTKGVLNYAPFENTYNFFKKNGWDMRAHTLLWGGNHNADYHCIPQWVMNLSSTPKAMYDTCRMRVKREVTKYKGIVKEYDVLNEPTHANYLQKIVGDSINWNCFKWAREADPDARLFVNDFNIIEWQDQTDNFIALVRKMLANGAPITGIGAQCHIGSSVDLTNFKNRFDQLGQFGLPIKITEFDMSAKSLTEQQYAAEIGKMMRLAFSHPSIEGFVFWGLTEPTWVPASIINLIREDKTPRLAADTLYDLVHKVWNTDLNLQTDADGIVAFNGYYGDYEILVKNGNRWEQFATTCLKSEKGKQVTLTLGQGKAPRPKLTGMEVTGTNTIQLTFDRTMNNPSSNLANFKLFGYTMNYFTSAALKAGDSTRLVLTTNAPIRAKDYLPVSYLPGTLTAANGTALESFGPVLPDNLVNSFVSAKTSTNGKVVYLAFDRKLNDTSVSASDFRVWINNRPDSVTAAKRGSSGDVVELTLAEAVKDTFQVVLTEFQGGSLKTTDNRFVAASEATKVGNLVQVPSFVSAVTSISGLYITLTFSQVMADPTGMQSSFAVSSGSRALVPVSAVSLVGGDKTQIKLTLAQPVYQGETVRLTYTPGSLTAATGVPSKSFNATVSNISYTDVDRQTESEPKPYPNPFKDELRLDNTAGFRTLQVFDLTGRLRLVNKLEPNTKTTVETIDLEAGVYMLVLSDGNDKRIFRIVK